MINVSHHRDNGCSGLWSAFLTGQRLFEALLDLFCTFQNNAMPQFFHNQRRGILVEHLVDGRHDTQIHELFDDLARFDSHLLRQIAYGDVLGDIDVINDFFGWLLESMLIWLIR